MSKSSNAVGEPATVASLVGELQAFVEQRGFTSYEIAKRTGGKVDIKTVDRFFKGLTAPSDVEKAPTSTGVGRVRFDTALAIIQALGFDLEIVAKHPKR